MAPIGFIQNELDLKFLVCLLYTSYHKIPVGHVEAGLRTYDKWSPFPEEMKRKMVGAIADMHFCPCLLYTSQQRFKMEVVSGASSCFSHRSDLLTGCNLVALLTEADGRQIGVSGA